MIARLVAALAFITALAVQADAPPPFTQNRAREIIANLQKVVTPNGVDVRE